MKLIFKFAFLLVFIFTCSFALAEEFPNTVTAELVSDASSLDTEMKIKLGVLFKLEPGWHIYWKNSGDSGLPTKVEFTLPEGFEARNLMWPLPSSYKRAGNVLDYGYENSVLLWADVKVPPEHNENSVIPVTVKTSWVSCEDVCIPGKSEIKAELNLNNKKNDLFKKWESLLPAVNKNIKSTVGVVKIDENKSMYTIKLKFEEPVEDIEFFPVPGKSLELEDITYSNKDSKNKKIFFNLSLYPGKALKSDRLESVIAYTDKNGDRRGVEFPINISKVSGKK